MIPRYVYVIFHWVTRLQEISGDCGSHCIVQRIGNVVNWRQARLLVHSECTFQINGRLVLKNEHVIFELLKTS